MHTVRGAYVALECDASTDVNVGDVVTVERVDESDDGATRAYTRLRARARANDGEPSTSVVQSFDARASGVYVRAFAAFGDRGKMHCVGARRGAGRDADARETKILVCRCDVTLTGISGRALAGTTREDRIAVLGHATTEEDGMRERRDAEAAAEDAEIGFCGVVGCTTHVGDRKATLSATLEELRPEMRRRHEIVQPAVAGYLCAGDLPEDITIRIMSFMDARTAGMLACTCKGFRSRVEETSSTLALTLHPHQRAALGWMRRRERSRLASIRDPLWRRLDCEQGHALWLNMIRGDLSDVPPETHQDSQGGMLCDEPGLGKTVTAIALILARRGWRPSPPVGNTARQMGSKWYYEDTNSVGNGGGYGLPAIASVPRLNAETPAFTPTKTAPVNGSASRGNSSGLRRSKRSAGNTPVGYFAAVCRDGLNGTMGSSAKRSKLEEKKAFDALAAATIENPDWQTRLECSAHSTPIGFIARDGLKEDSARLARNTRYFETVLKNCVLYVGRAATCDVVDYILENTIEVSHAMPVSMPPFRRNSDQPPVFQALGLVKFSGTGKVENAVPFGPPGAAVEDLILDKQALHDAIRVVDNRGSDSETLRIWLSSATLVIIPSVLIEHWLQQITFCTGDVDVPRVAVIDKAPKTESNIEHDVKMENKLKPTFINDLNGFDASDLANDFDVVIMPINRLSTEFSKTDTPILRVFWQRVIMDEGHQLGASLALTAKLSVACALRAHARWLMTGTPTPTTLKGAGTAHLQPLLGFLRQAPYGMNAGLWTTAVQRPLDGKNRSAQMEAVARLGDVLRRCMVRTCKSHITLPPLKRSVAMLKFSDVHAESYNDLVAHVKRSLLLADWGDPNHEESLLNPKNVGPATAAVSNLREAACVVGKMPTTFDPDEFDETIRDLHTLLKKRGFGEEERKTRVRRVSPILMQCKGTCDLCLHEVLMPLVTPCAHILCCGCVMQGPPKGKTIDGSVREDEIEEHPLPPGVYRAPRGCPVCALSYVMQRENPYNPNPAQAVPEDLIELQPSYIQHPWKVDESQADGVYAQGESSKVDYLLSALRKMGAAVTAEVLAQQDARDAFFSREVAGVAAHTPGWNGDFDLNHPTRDEPQQGRRNRRRMLDAATPLKPRDFNPSAPRPKKCIVYSAFKPHLDAIDLALYGARVPHESIARIGQSRHDKERALKRFKKDPDVAVLLLNRAAAEGLDLSFVSHVFLMEPLSNMSLEEQIVSRAHRMGQMDTVHVEVLAMENTAEATMLDVQAELIRKPAQDQAREVALVEGGTVENAIEADVAPTVVVESLSRRRILERLQLVASKGSDEAAAKKIQEVKDRVDSIEKNGSNGRILGTGQHKGDLEEANLMREALEASAREIQARGGSVPEIGSPQAVKRARSDEREEDEQKEHSWTLRFRDPIDRGVVKELTLPNGGKTTAAAMRARIASTCGSSLDGFVLSCGFPPRALGEKDMVTPISLLGIRQNDLINLRAANAPDMRQADKPTSILTTVVAERPKAAKPETPARVVDTAVLDARVQKRLANVLKASETSTAMMLQDPDAEGGDAGGVAGAMSIDLLRAAETAGGKRVASDPTIRSLQDAFKSIVEERAKETEGNAKCAAARAGNVQYSTLPDGRLVVKYSAPDVGRGQVRQTERSDCVQDVPAPILPFILAAVAADAENSRANLSPPAMAVASPRVFWAVVRHGRVGPDVTFTDALRSIAPNVADWDAVSARERRVNPRYADYDTSGR